MLAIALADAAHLIVQGAPGSGKSTGIYGLLAWLAPATDVMVVASHVTGLTPSPRGPVTADWHALGNRDLAAHVRSSSARYG